MIDLSFLTDEEQETILAVLKRDADLKKAEEERIKNLQRAVKDKGLLKYLTGEWFYETKLLRHQDRIHGSDIIKASMRSRQKPLTILELSQILPEKQSFVGSDNQDVYIPPELCGLIQACTEPRERGQSLSPCEIPQVIPKPMVQSPTKQRWNPFNSERPPTHAPKGERGQVGVEPMEAEQAPSEEPSPSFDFTMSKGECHEESPGGASESIALPMPITTRVVDTSQDSLIDAEGSPGGHTNSAAPRGILKHMPNSSSTDSLSSRLAPQEATGLDSPVKTDNAKESLDWLDRKQVRFSAAGRSGEQWQDGKELGEHGLLDVDSVNATEEENNNDFAKIKDTVVGLCEPLPTPRDLDIGEDGLSCESGINDQKQNDGPHQSPGDLCEQDHDESHSPQGSKLHSAQQESGKRPRLETGDEEDGQSKAKGIKGIVGFEDATMPQAWLPGKNRNKHDISVEAASDTKPLTNYSSKKPFHSVSPVSKKRLLGIFRRSGAKEKSAELVGSHKEKRPTEEELDDNAIILQTSEYADNTSGDNQINVTAVKEETKTPAPIEVRTLQLTALQNTNFKDLMSSLSSGSDYQQEPIESKDRVSKCPQRLSNLKAFWEKGNSGPKVIFTRDQAINENSTQAETDDSHNGQPVPNVESRNTLRMEWTERNEAEENKAQESKAQSNDKDIQKIEGNLLLDSPKQDGTYRASPILISDETDDSSAGSVTELPSQDSVATSLHTSLSCHNDLQQGDSLIPLPTQSLPDGNQPIKITNLKSFWEKEFTGPRIIVGSARAPIQFRLGNSHLNSQVVPSYSDLKKPLSIKEEEAQSSDNESKSGVSIIKPMTVKGFVSRSSGNSQSKSDATIGTAEKPEENQFDIKREVLFSQERSLGPSRSQSPRSRDSSDDELWRSPSKTCHPKVLPRESSSPKGSPLKTFPIDFALKTKDPRSELVRPTPAARQKKTSLPEAKQPGWIDIRNSTGILSGTPVLTLEDLEQATTAKPQQSNQNTPIVRQYKKASESEPRLGDSSEVLGTHFARSFVPQDYQYYLGAPEKAHLPPFNQEEAAGEPNVNISAPATPVPTTQARSQSRASSGSHDDASIPLRSTLKQRLMPSSKSLENLVSHAKEEKNKDSSNSSRGQLNLSVDDVSSSPTSSGPSYLEQMKNMSASVPALQEQEMDSDSPSESNMSLSSGMASMSSVSGSVSSIYNADFGDIEVQGTIQLAVNYVQKLGEFQIFVVQCRDLAVADPKKNRSDPYVKCYLLPDKTKLGKRKTSIKKKTLNPSYSEVLRFKILMEVLKTQKLNISVWHNDTFRRNSFLGEVDLDLSDWDYNNTQIIDHALKPRVSEQKSTLSASLSQLIENRGEMRIALRFLLQMSHSKRTSTTATGEVQIWVKDCKNLPPVRGVIIDPFVKCTVLPDTSKRSRQKTRVVKRTANPMFNHTMVYNGFRPEDLREACAEITIWDHDRLSNHYIGGLRLGLGTGKSYGAEVAWMDSTTPEAKLWERMMQSNGEWVEDILPLRMFAIAKSMSK